MAAGDFEEGSVERFLEEVEMTNYGQIWEWCWREILDHLVD
ncbi:hypothetical protein COLO4_06755 [Corchorus olitorius]|uniref:Uncharacterized protein n=1 Tax=Corchorus olitorius TaxID=93759 RepID=A0A1R3KM25_9ROSI|nr:hypothetical protein COLO4_06755 [Corchorus olitorius]